MDNNTPQPTPITYASSVRNYLLATALILVPALIGLGVVLAIHKAKPVAQPPPCTAANALLDAAAPQLADLAALRRELRRAGEDTEAVNVKIWAAHAYTPTALFHLAPPEEGSAHWFWDLSQDGRFAVAASAQADSAQRRAVGLFDLITDEWVWKKTLPWPDAHESPYVFNRHVVVRYTKNARRFAMEIDAGGAITGIDSLGASAFQPTRAAMAPVPGFPETPVAIRSGVLFTVGTDQTLCGYALEKLPGLRYAGRGNLNTVFSGNGLLKFTVQDGVVTVSDSLTQTVLQRVNAWKHTTNTVVTGTLVTPDGSQLSIFLRTTFPGTPPQPREWSVSLATYTGTVTPSFSADALLAKPKISLQKQAVSADGRWRVSVSPSNDLSFAVLPEGREIASVKLGTFLGASTPIDHLAFLEEGRQILLRQGNAFWLLDFAAVRGQADLLARIASCEKYVPLPTPVGAKDGLPAPATPSPLIPATSTELAGSFLALHGEWYTSHQAWGYAAASFEEAATRSASDGRAPRVSPLLLSRAQILSGQMPKARRVCREALMRLLTDPSVYNRMIRYELQGLLFSRTQENQEEPKTATPEPQTSEPSAVKITAKPATKPTVHHEAKTHGHKSAPLDTPHRSR